MTENNFYNYLKANLPTEKFNEGLKSLFGSPHRRTKALNDPTTITHAELIELADLLDTSAWQLYHKMEVGKEVVTEKEAEQLLLVHNLTMPAPVSV